MNQNLQKILVGVRRRNRKDQQALYRLFYGYGMSVGFRYAKDLSDREDILSRIGYKELIGMVQSLSLAYRTVFNMHVIDGFKHEEIASKLGISVGTSKSNLSKARQKLQLLVVEHLKVSNHG